MPLELKARIDDIAKRVQQSVKNDTASAALIATLIGIVEILFWSIHQPVTKARGAGKTTG